MNFASWVDIRLPNPICWAFDGRSITVGFSDRCDVQLPAELKWSGITESAELEPLLIIHRRRGSAVDPSNDTPIWSVQSICGHARLIFKRLGQHGAGEENLDMTCPSTHNRAEVGSGSVLSVAVNREYPEGLFPLGQIVFGSDVDIEESEPVEAEEEEEEEEVPPQQTFLSLPPEIMAKIFRFLDFETVAVVLPTVSRDLFDLATKALEDQVWTDLQLPRGLQGINMFVPLAEFGVAGARLSFGERLETLRLFDERAVQPTEVPSPVWISDCHAFFELVPNLNELVIGTGFLVFGGFHQQFTSDLRSLSICWEIAAHWKDPFPFSAFRGLKSLVINGIQQSWHDYPPHMEPRQLEELSTLDQLEVLTIAGCIFPGESRFLDVLKNLRGTLKTLRLPECAWVRDKVLEFFSENFRNLEIFEISGTPHVSDDGFGAFVRHPAQRRLRALIARNMEQLKGEGWLDAPGAPDLPEALDLIDLSGSGCSHLVTGLAAGGRLPGFQKLPGDWEHLGRPRGQQCMSASILG